MGLLRRRRGNDESSHEEIFEMFGEPDPDDFDETSEADEQDAAFTRFGGFSRRDRIVMAVAGLVCAASVTGAVHAMATNSAAVADEQAQDELALVQGDRTASQEALRDQHEAVLGGLEDYDLERAAADQTVGQQLIGDMASQLGSTNGTAASADLLDQRYEALDADSQVLTDFLPQLVSATTKTPQLGQDPIRYSVSEVRILPAFEVPGEDAGDEAAADDETRQYLLTAQLDPVRTSDQNDADDAQDSQYVLIRYSTDRPGELDAVTAELASDPTADRLSTDEDQGLGSRASADESQQQD